MVQIFKISMIDSKLLSLESFSSLRKKFKEKKIVLCHGVFDLLHIGHIDYLESAKKFGDILIVSITSDKVHYLLPLDFKCLS